MSEIREQVLSYLRTRPDLNYEMLTAHTSLASCTGRGFLMERVKETPRIREEFERVMALARSGEILTPGGGANVITLAEQSGRVRRVAKSRDFYLTDTVRRVGQVLDYCGEHAAIGVVTGEYGVGKTEALKAWRRGAGRKVEHLVLEFDAFTSTNKVFFMQLVADALGLGIPAKASYGGGQIFLAVRKHLQQNPYLLIFDQCEAVSVKVFQVIRQLWDRTHDVGCGAVLMAAPALLARMTINKSADLGALTSRVGVWAPLAGLSKAEMAEILKQEGLTDVDEAAFDVWWKATQGSMRRLMRAVDLLKSKHAGKRVTVKTIAGVAGHLWGMQIAEAA